MNAIITRSIEAVDNFTIANNKDAKRATLAKTLIDRNIEYYNNGEAVDSGLYGKVKELLSHDEKSTIYRVQAQNRTDAYIIVDGKRKPLEVKTNGGRIENLYRLKAKDNRYISYTLDIVIKAGKPRKDGTCKPAEHRYGRRIDAFELWCWRRLLRVPWTARRSNQSIPKEISPGCSLEGMMLKLKLQYFGHLM